MSINVFLHQNQAGVKELESLLLEELANPLSPRYGQWLDSFQVMAYTAPPEEQQLRAARWMESTGMSCRLYGDFAVLSGTVAQAEQLFQVRFWVLAHPRLSYTMVRCLDEPTLPAEMRDIIHMVPSFGRLFEPQQRYAKRPAAAAGQTDSVNYGVVPQTVRQLYNIPESAQCLSSKSSLAVVEFGNSAGISFTDLTTFQKQTSSTRSNVTSIVGNFQPFNPANGDDGESTLDVQYALAVAANLTVHGGSFGFWVVQGWIEDFTTLVQQRQQDGQFVPWIFSISYGWAELQACRVAGLGLNCVAKNESEPYVVRTNTELMKIGSTGVTIIGLSQDAGAASKWNMACDKTPEVNPSWPGASPYITTLGATQVLNGQILPGSSTSPICSQLTCLDGTTGTEVVCSVATGALITSGGGFSIYAPALPYQSTAVAGFLKGPGLRPPASMFNPANRGEADIALIGHALQVVLDGQWLAVDGTSASAPIFAGMATLLNDIRFQNNRAPLGFLNPLLYTLWAQTPSAYHDITIGNNTATEYPNTCTTPGYGAVPGWDPPTGLGCPLYSQFASYVSSLP